MNCLQECSSIVAEKLKYAVALCMRNLNDEKSNSEERVRALVCSGTDRNIISRNLLIYPDNNLLDWSNSYNFP
ncbi:hypothetical protein FQA39_LY07231 [Lamprigera yunnana]|nr:hypothetical protein FQA39_LY07231 [Lamprigera yunnana]